MHSVIFLQEQFRQIGTVLASDSGNQGNFLGLFHLRSNRVLRSFVIIKRGNNQALSAVRESNVPLPRWCKGLPSDEQRMLATHGATHTQRQQHVPALQMARGSSEPLSGPRP